MPPKTVPALSKYRPQRRTLALPLVLSALSCAGGRGADGQDGTDCTVTDSNGSATITCEDGTVGTVNAGKTGPAGADGSDGSNGSNGADGENGATGTDGANGTNALVALLDEPAGTHCAQGGTAIATGQDLNGNGTLEPTEIDATKYVCNGVGGAVGKASLILSQTEAPGAHCVDGGIAIQSGIDNNTNGLLEPTEVTRTQYLCQTVCTVTRRTQTAKAIENVNINYSTGEVLANVDVLAQSDATHDVIGWMGFDLTNLPANSVVVRATLVVRHNATSADNAGSPTLQVMSGAANHFATAPITSTTLQKGPVQSAPNSTLVVGSWNSIILDLSTQQFATDRSDGFLTLGLSNVSLASSSASFFGSLDASTRPYLEFDLVACD